MSNDYMLPSRVMNGGSWRYALRYNFTVAMLNGDKSQAAGWMRAIRKLKTEKSYTLNQVKSLTK